MGRRSATALNQHIGVRIHGGRTSKKAIFHAAETLDVICEGQNVGTSHTMPPSAVRRSRLGNLRQFRSDVQKFAWRFGKVHAEKWKINPRRARELTVFYLRKYLPSATVGRPRSAKVTRALEMRQQGKRWPEIYAELISGTDPDRRRAKQLRLRAAVRFRMRH